MIRDVTIAAPAAASAPAVSTPAYRVVSVTRGAAAPSRLSVPARSTPIPPLRPLPRPHRSRLALAAACALALALATQTQAAAASEPTATADRLVVRFKHSVSATARAAAVRDAGATRVGNVGGADVVRPRAGISPAAALKRLENKPTVAWAERSLVAGAAYVPNDSGVASAAGPPAGWAAVQWELNGPFGINAPAAWSQASRLGGSGGRGVTVAVLDSGVAYNKRGPYAVLAGPRPGPLRPGLRLHRQRSVPDRRVRARHLRSEHHRRYGEQRLRHRRRRLSREDHARPGARLRRQERRGHDRARDPLRGAARRRRHQPLARALRRPAAAADAAQRHDLAHRPRRAARSALQARRRRVGGGQQLRHARARPRPTTRSRSTSAARPSTAAWAATQTTVGAWTSSRPAAAFDAPLRNDIHCDPEGVPGRDISGVSFKASAPSQFEMLPGFRGTSSAAPHVTGVVALVLASKVLGPAPDLG